MHFHQVLNEELGCASYLLADQGEAVVVDPRWDVDVYLELASAADARITHVVDTHDHADHVSGRGRLARRTGAAVHRPGGDLQPGDEVRAGRILLTALGTPGHRPEHVSLVVRDLARSEVPWCVLTGDSLLVGDVARPDLAVDKLEGARALHESLQRIFALGDHLEAWPAHVGGSLCGGNALSPKTSTTVGYERRSSSPAALPGDAFVETVCAAAPPKPPNLQAVVERNCGDLAEEPAPVVTLEAGALVASGATILDARPAARFDAAHLAGALSFPPGPGRVTRAGWAVRPDERVVVVDTDADAGKRFVNALHAIGLWNVVGVTAADPDAWRAAGLEVDGAEAWDVGALAAALRDGSVALVDVREEREWRAGHVDGSIGLPLHALGGGRDPVPALDGGLIAVACAGGGRAALAASILRRAGHPRVVRVAGGGIGNLPDHGVSLVEG